MEELAVVDVRASSEIRPEEYCGVHPMLEVLISESFEHLERQFGRAVAEREFGALFRSLAPPRRQGRPQKLPLETIQKMKALRDKGRSFGEIGVQLSFDRHQVQAAIKHHYPRG